MNWRDIIRDKRLLLGVAAAGGLGLIVLLRRKGGAGYGGGPTEQGGSTTLQPGTYDSTGSDIYNGLQALYSGTDDRWAELVQRLDDVQSRLPKTPTTPAPTPAANAGTRKSTVAGSGTVSVKTKTTSGRWSWANLVDYWYNTTGWSQAQKDAAARRLADANKWRWFGHQSGPYTSATVAGGQPVSLPTRL